MKTIAKLAIVMIAIATIFSFSAVAADKPENIPSDGPLTDLSTMLSEIITTLNEIFGITQTMDSNVTSLQTSIDDNFSDVDTSLAALQDNLSAFRADVNENFTSVNNSINNLAFDNVAKIVSRGGILNADTEYLNVQSQGSPFKVTLSVAPQNTTAKVWQNIGGNPSAAKLIDIEGQLQIQTFEFACKRFTIENNDSYGANPKIHYSYVISYSGDEPLQVVHENI
jgi:hypothetical protein